MELHFKGSQIILRREGALKTVQMKLYMEILYMLMFIACRQPMIKLKAWIETKQLFVSQFII